MSKILINSLLVKNDIAVIFSSLENIDLKTIVDAWNNLADNHSHWEDLSHSEVTEWTIEFIRATIAHSLFFRDGVPKHKLENGLSSFKETAKNMWGYYPGCFEGLDSPKWEELSPECQASWEAAARAIYGDEWS